jgi:hypothetical protein
MLRMIRGIICVLLSLVLAGLASAGTITVTSPSSGAYLGSYNTLTFEITGNTASTVVKATIVGPGGATTTSQATVSANSSGGSLPISFNSSSRTGDYTITVTGTASGLSFNSPVVTVHVLPVAPKFLDFSPITGRYVTGTVKISATIGDANLDNWKVQVDSSDIPNNTGSSTTVLVNWDTSAETNNTSHTITITATDLAGNSTTQSMTVTIDRTKPTINVTYPQSSVAVIAGSQISVVIDITGIASGAIDPNGVDVLAETTSGTYLTRVARVSTSSLNSTTLRWQGRILTSSVKLPKQFKIVVNAIDLAGNVATPLTVTVNLK